MLNVSSLSTIVLILPYCSCFSPSALANRASQAAASQIRHRAKRNNEEVSERIRDAALSIIALSAPVLLNEPLQETTTEIKDTTDDFESLFDEQDMEKSPQKEDPVTVKTNQQPKSNGKAPAAHVDPNDTPRLRLNSPAADLTEHPRHDGGTTGSEAQPSSQAADARLPNQSWGELLLKEEPKVNATISRPGIFESVMGSVPSKVELQQKVTKVHLPAMNTETEPVTDTTRSPMEASARVTKSKVVPDYNELTSTLEPQLASAVSTSFGKQLSVIREGLPPLQQWPERESEKRAKTSSNPQ